MKVRHWLFAIVIGIGTLLGASSVLAAAEVGFPLVKPAGITTGVATEIVVNAFVLDPGVIPASVVVQRVDASGRFMANLGPLNDSGLNGDVDAGDGLFSGRVTLSEPQAGRVYLQVSAAFLRVLKRVVSETVAVEVVAPGVPNQLGRSNMERVVTDIDSGAEILCDEVIAQFVSVASLDQIQVLVASIGGTVIGRLPELGFWQVRVTCTGDASGVRQAIALLKANPLVTFAAPNVIGVVNEVSDPRIGEQWGLQFINAEAAWDKTRGSSAIKIGVVDSGIREDHEDLAGSDKLVIGEDFGASLYPDSITDSYFAHCGTNQLSTVKQLAYRLAYLSGPDAGRDDNGHGTSVAGIAAAKTDNSKGIAGTCPNCKLIASKVSNYCGFSSSLTVAAGIMDALQRGAHVINMSLGFANLNAAYSRTPPDEVKPVGDAVMIAIAKRRVPVVASAGNGNCNKPQYPAAFPGVISVGAIDRNWQTSRFVDAPTDCTQDHATNYGDDWVHVYAPGGDKGDDVNDIVSTKNDGSYTKRFNGTSAAAPFVSGVVGLMLSQNSALTPGVIRTTLMQEAQVRDLSRDPEGAYLKILDAENAVARADDPPKISIDGDPSDWAALKIPSVVPCNDGGFCSTELSMKVTRDDDYLYVLGEIANPNANSWIYLLLDSDDNPGTGCPSLGYDGIMAIRRRQPDLPGIGPPNNFDTRPFGWVGSYVVRNCQFAASNDFPGQLVWAQKDAVFEMSVPIDVIRTLAPGTSRVRLYAQYQSYVVFDLDSGAVLFQTAVSPLSGSWTASPQNLNVGSSGATTIYYTMVNTYDGSTPANPAAPTRSSNNGSIGGPSATFQLYANSGELKKIKLRFVGCNGASCGPPSGVLSYTLDLSKPGNVSVNPASGSWTASPQNLNVGSPGATTIYYTMVNTYDGSTPVNPAAPSPSSNNGSIGGPSGTFQLFANAGQDKRSKLRFVGCNGKGCGPVSGVYAYRINRM